MLLGVKVQARPVGLKVEVRLTFPVKPLTGVTVIVELSAAADNTLIVVELADRVKSG